MFRTALISLSLLALGTAAASAHETKASIDAREQRQLGQIEQGRQDGSITWTEGIKLRAEQKFIAKREEQMMADGKLSKAEKGELARLQAEAAAHIKEEKNDGQHRPGFLPRVGR